MRCDFLARSGNRCLPCKGVTLRIFSKSAKKQKIPAVCNKLLKIHVLSCTMSQGTFAQGATTDKFFWTLHFVSSHEHNNEECITSVQKWLLRLQSKTNGNMKFGLTRLVKQNCPVDFNRTSRRRESGVLTPDQFPLEFHIKTKILVRDFVESFVRRTCRAQKDVPPKSVIKAEQPPVSVFDFELKSLKRTSSST